MSNTRHYRYIQLIVTRYPEYFRALGARDQTYLLGYYRPQVIQTDADLEVARQRLAHRRPALPQQAGRAFAKLLRIVEAGELERLRLKARPSGKARSVRVTSVRREQPDFAGLSKALINHALSQSREAASRSDSASERCAS